MSWHCIQYISSPERAEASSPIFCLDISQSPLAKSKNIQGESCYKGSLTEFYQSFPFGTTLELCDQTTQNAPKHSHCGKEYHRNSPFVAGSRSHARTYPPLEAEKDSKGPGVDSGWKWQESSVKWSRNTSLWRTRQCSLLADLDVFSETWPKWGMMRDGECWEQMPLEPVIIAPESGYVPTPCASDYKGGARNGRDIEFKHWLKRRHGKSYPHPQRVEEMMLWPIGWSELAPLETDKFQQWLASHGKSCPPIVDIPEAKS